ncbi:MAG: hypothetical protein IM631_12180 [Cytophagales bacterium]|nr:hypothetical protein [Cytophagales bacterium]MCA6372128.1 hypothetical protein [Cytophagales bacterium]MCA6382272.1 hypothetical protein [Cytophagales bacterium]
MINKDSIVYKTLYDILHAHCLSSQCTDEVFRLSGIKGRLYNGKRDYWQLRNILLRAISEQKAREIINQIPFPFIQNYYPGEDDAQVFFSQSIQENRVSWFWMDDVLAPLTTPKGTGRIESAITGCGTTYKTRKLR